MTTPSPQPGHEPTAGGSAGGPLEPFFAWCRSLGITRRSDGSWLGGVCTGVAARFDLDPLAIRAVFIALSVMGGLGLPVYLAGWFLLPDAHGQIHAQQAVRRADARGILLGLLTLAAVLGALNRRNIGWLLLLGAIATWIAVRRSRAAREHGDGASSAGGVGFGSGGPALSHAAPAGPGGAPEATAVMPAGTSGAPTYATAPSGGPEAARASGSGPVTSAISAPHGLGPGRTWSPPTGVPPAEGPASWPPPGAVRPPRIQVVMAKRRAGGPLFLLLVLGLAALGYGTAWSAATASGVTDQPEVLAAAVALGAVALALIAVGLRGWRAPGTATLGLLAAGALSVVLVAPGGLRALDGVGERHWAPTTTPLAAEYRLGLGEATLDLSGLPVDTPADPTSVSVGLGELTVRVPEGMAVEVDARVGTGDLTVTRPGRPPETVDSGPSATSIVRLGEGDPSLVVQARVGLGELRIIQEGAPS